MRAERPPGSGSRACRSTRLEQTCAALQLPFERELVDFVIEELHRRRGVELLPVHPRDLLRMIVDRLRYEEQDILIDRDLLTWAWDSNFFQSR